MKCAGEIIPNVNGSQSLQLEPRLEIWRQPVPDISPPQPQSPQPAPVPAPDEGEAINSEPPRVAAHANVSTRGFWATMVAGVGLGTAALLDGIAQLRERLDMAWDGVVKGEASLESARQAYIIAETNDREVRARPENVRFLAEHESGVPEEVSVAIRRLGDARSALVRARNFLFRQYSDGTSSSAIDVFGRTAREYNQFLSKLLQEIRSQEGVNLSAFEREARLSIDAGQFSMWANQFLLRTINHHDVPNTPEINRYRSLMDTARMEFNEALEASPRATFLEYIGSLRARFGASAEVVAEVAARDAGVVAETAAREAGGGGGGGTLIAVAAIGLPALALAGSLLLTDSGADDE